MVGKVINLDEKINPDSLARMLVSMYNNWYLQSSIKHEEWKELRNYLFATDTSHTTGSTLPWKNKTTIPKLTQIRDNLHANYMDALFPNDDWLKWEGYDKSSVTKKKRLAIEAYIKNKLRESNFRETVSQLLYDYIDYGNCFVESVWINEGHIDENTKEWVSTYTGAKAFRISPFDHVFNPTAVSYKKSPKFTRYIKSIGELKKDIKNFPELKYEDSVLKRALEMRKSISGIQTEDLAKAEAYAVDGFGSLSEYYSSGLVELIDFEGDIYDETTDTLYENRLITIIDRCYIIRNITNPSWYGEDNKHHVGWRNRPDNLYAMGALDNLVGMQYRLDHLENLKADALDMTIMPPLKIVGDVEAFVWSPNAEIHVPEDGDVVPLAPNAAAFQVNNEIAYLLSLMEEMAGAPKEAMGMRTPGEKTAFEVSQLQNAASRIFQHKVNKFETELLEPLLNTMLEQAKRNLDVTDVVRVMDDDLGVADFMSITKEDLTAKGKLRPIGARHYATRAQLLQNLTGIFNSQLGATIAPHVSSKELAKLVEEYMGFERYGFIKDNIAIFEQQETQRLINQASATLESETALPTDEDLL